MASKGHEFEMEHAFLPTATHVDALSSITFPNDLRSMHLIDALSSAYSIQQFCRTIQGKNAKSNGTSMDHHLLV
jgi:hypothetical protein